MATKISELSSETAETTDSVPVVSGAATVKVTVASIGEANHPGLNPALLAANPGKLLAVSGDGTVVEAVEPSSTPRAKPSDANTVVLWTMNESASPYANSGNGGALNMADSVNGTPFKVGATALLGTAPFNTNNKNQLTASSTIKPASSTSFTVSVWVYIHAYAASAYAFLRYYSGVSWSSPYATFWMGQTGAAGKIDFKLTTNAGVSHSGSPDDNYNLPLKTWCHLAMTYDGTTHKGYINGNLVYTEAFSATIGFQNSAGYAIGGISDAGTNWVGVCQYGRVEDGVRTEAELRAEYKNGLGWFDT